MKKIVELRTKVDVFVLKHVGIMVFIAITVLNPWVGDSIEWLMEKLEDFFAGPLNMSWSVADDTAEMVVIYTLIVGSYKFITWATSYIMRVIRNHKKASKEVSE